MRILGIETSCDETAVAIYDGSAGLLAHSLYSQIPLHNQYGGVVPELASRDHVRKLIPLLDEVLHQANCKKNAIDAIAYTAGPGLIGALLVGASFAKSLSFALTIPCIPVHHMEAHLLAVMLEAKPPKFPFLALLVSGGHTLLIHAKQVGDYEILGETLDDAVGEAFDKTAKVLGLSYPGGPAIARLAEKGHPHRFSFPRPMTKDSGLNFSFSGLKTSVLNTWQQAAQDEQTRADIAYAFQEAVVETCIIKCRHALAATGLTQLVIAGGVGANQSLRQGLFALTENMGVTIYYPRAEFCTDNAAMVAYTGYQKFTAGCLDASPLTISVRARWPLSELFNG